MGTIIDSWRAPFHVPEFVDVVSELERIDQQIVEVQQPGITRKVIDANQLNRLRTRKAQLLDRKRELMALHNPRPREI